MKHPVLYFLYHIKLYSKKWSVWIEILATLLLLVLVGHVHLPSADNVTAGIYTAESVYAQRIAASLQTEESLYHFVTYESADALTGAVKNGSLECGFLFASNFDHSVDDLDMDESILVITSPFTTKSEVIKESVYNALLEILGEQIIKSAGHTLFPDADADAINQIIEDSRNIRNAGDVFHMEYHTIEVPQENVDSARPIYLLQGLFGLFLFLIMFLNTGRKFKPEMKAYEMSLTARERYFARMLSCLASGVLPAICGCLFLFAASKTTLVSIPFPYRGMAKELTLLLGLLLLNALWISLVCNLIHTQNGFIAALLVCLVLHLLLCPIFVDLGTYVPALRYLRYLLPLGWYLL